MTTRQYYALAALALLAAILAGAAPSLLYKKTAGATLAEPSEEPQRGGPSVAVDTRQPLPPPEGVAALFGYKPSAKPQAPAQLPEAAKADWLRPLGEIENGEGVRFLFFKDERTGRVLKVRADGLAEDAARLMGQTPDSFTIETQDGIFVVPRRR